MKYPGVCVTEYADLKEGFKVVFFEVTSPSDARVGSGFFVESAMTQLRDPFHTSY